jgi:zinc transport system substrate-binding protein
MKGVMKNITKYNNVLTIGFLFFLISLQTVCSRADERYPLRVSVSIPPQSYFVERIGGDRVLVDVLVLPGRSPATYAPNPSQISSLAKSDVYFRVGVPFENLLVPRLGSIAANLLVVDTRRGIQLRKMHTGHHAHGEGQAVQTPSKAMDETVQALDGEGDDPHIWLDPNRVKQQAATICDALIALDPGGKGVYRSNLDRFVADLQALHQRLQRVLEPFTGDNLYVFHPSFGYFADAYGLRQVSIEIEGKSPKGKDLYHFIQMAKLSKARIIFVQPQFDQQAAGKIASAIRGAVVPLDPLAGNYMENMAYMASKIAEVMGRQ